MYARIGARIKKARIERCFSQNDLGAILGLTATAINYYEKGKRKIGIEDLYRLAEALERPVEYFLSGEDFPISNREKQIAGIGAEIINDMTHIPVIGAIRAGEAVFSEQSLIGFLPLPRKKAVRLHSPFGLKATQWPGKEYMKANWF